MEKKIVLGKTARGEVYLNASGQYNGHIAIFGVSGSGKSVAGQKIMVELCASGATVLTFDLHQTFADEHIFPTLMKRIKGFSCDIDPYTAGIKLPLFTPVKLENGECEDQIDVISSVTSIFANALGLRCRQKSELYRAMEGLANSGRYRSYGIAGLEDMLSMLDGDTAGTIRDKLRYILAKNVFQDGTDWLYEKKLNILRISRFDIESQALIAEVLLSFVWRLGNAGKFRTKPIFILVDECQVLQMGKNSLIHTIISEGRKMGINLILITQSLAACGASAKNLLQAGLKLYFKPREDETIAIAKAISGTRYRDFLIQLRSLQVGECIAAGALCLNGMPIDRPLRLKI